MLPIMSNASSPLILAHRGVSSEFAENTIEAFAAALPVLLGLALVFTPVAIVTGLFTWWLNYASARVTPIMIKLAATPVLFLALLWTFIESVKTPDILAEAGQHVGFVLVVLALMPIVSVIGWFGAALTFPPHDD